MRQPTSPRSRSAIASVTRPASPRSSAPAWTRVPTPTRCWPPDAPISAWSGRAASPHWHPRCSGPSGLDAGEDTMARTVADVLIETLLDWDVEVVFGLPGDGINGIMEALRTRQDRICFVQVRHEESAAFMACGYAKDTGRLG